MVKTIFLCLEGIAKFMEYTTLGIMMHDTCNASCDICSVKCSPSCTREFKYVEVQNVSRLVRICEMLGMSYIVAATKLREEKVGELVDEFDNDTICLNFMT